jgi:hypothetical protein
MRGPVREEMAALLFHMKLSSPKLGPVVEMEAKVEMLFLRQIMILITLSHSFILRICMPRTVGRVKAKAKPVEGEKSL